MLNFQYSKSADFKTSAARRCECWFWCCLFPERERYIMSYLV